MADAIDHSKLEPIPQPPEHFFGLLGNLPDIDPSAIVLSFARLEKLYGPIFKVNLTETVVIVGSQELVNEVCDQDRFKKVPDRALGEIRALLGDGLFTSYLEEPNWGKAHRLLMPAFGPLGIRKMFDDQMDISTQMILKWDREGYSHEINCADDFTRLAFDTVGLCAFSYRFNEFYADNAHPFARQMADVLIESGRRGNRSSLQNQLYWQAERVRQENVRKMHELCDQIVQERKNNPRPDIHDLLNTMLIGVDKETGEKLSDENIRYQMATLLVAGHETTSSTLSFLWYNLLKNPDKLHKAQQQVDEVVGDKVLTVDMIPKLTYIDYCIKESQRCNATIGAFSVKATKDQVIGGKYFIKEGQSVSCLLEALHHDRKVWGEDVDVYRPERFEEFQSLPPNSWKPFGNGVRACIGRLFAEQEMIMNTALILQRFQPEMADPTYELQVKSTLTIKPGNLKMRVRRRPGRSLLIGIPGGAQSESAAKNQAHHDQAHAKRPVEGQKQPVTVYFGGNTGTCESLASALEEKGPVYGLQVEVEGLDAATESLPTDRPCVIITSSYEGRAPDNAKKFVTWLQKLEKNSDKLESGVKYAVFGVGNSDWATTFHRIPRYVDETVGRLGGDRIIDAGYSNVKTDLVGPWEEWSEQLLQTLSGSQDKSQQTSGVNLAIQSSHLAQTLGGKEMDFGTVVSNRELVDASVGLVKRHMEVRLPEGSVYQSGDYLVVQGQNPEEVVHRVLTRFGLDENDLMSVQDSKKKFLPTTPTPVSQFLHNTVELAAPVTKRQLSTLAEHGKPGSDESKALEQMQQDDKYKEILAKRYSIIDILEDLPSLEVPFATYIDLLQPLSPRQYSISSSPLHPSNHPGATAHADIATLTYDVLTAPSLSNHGTFRGVASNYLATRRAGDRLPCFVRPTNVGFRMPPDAETPLILIAAGTGIAPMRAFVQERAAIQEVGVRRLGPALLFFGCRNEGKDFIYRDELRAWQEQGVVEVIPSFSRPDSGKGQYVSDALWEHRERVGKLFAAGGKIFLCGSAARLGKSTAETCKRIYGEMTGKSAGETDEWLESVRTSRYISDVY